MDIGTITFVIYWLCFMIIFPIALGVTRDLGRAEKETEE